MLRLGLSLQLSGNSSQASGGAECRFFGTGGSDAADGLTEGTRWLTWAHARDTTPTLGVAKLTDGTLGGSFTSFTTDITLAGQNGPASATITGTNTVRVIFYGSSTIGNPVLADVTVDAEGTSTNCVDISNTSNPESVTFSNVVFKNPAGVCIAQSKQTGVFNYFNCTMTHDMVFAALASSNQANAGPTTINWIGSNIDSDMSSNIIGGGVINPVSNMTTRQNAYKVNIKDSSITLRLAAGITAPTDIIGEGTHRADELNITGNTFDITSASTTAASVEIIKAAGVVAYPLIDLLVEDNLAYFDCASGFAYGVSAGEDPSYVENALIQNNVAVGSYFSGDTPHLYSASCTSDGDTVLIQNNIATDCFVGFISSCGYDTATNIIQDNLAMDCYGPSYYMKGNTDCTVRRNRAFISDKNDWRLYSALHIIQQGAFDNLAAQVYENTVVVRDYDTNFFSLAGNSSADNVGTFYDNEYIIPDTVDFNDPLFIIDGSAATETQWINKYGSSEVITRLPQATIDAMFVDAYAEIAAATLVAGV